MQNASDLKTQLQAIHRRSYPAYKSLKGSYQFRDFILHIDHVQGDPFASPSHIRIRLSHKTAGFPAAYYKDTLTRVTLADYLTRQFETQVNHYTFRAKGSGKSGLISVSHCGQEVLSRSACEITDKEITARFFIGFPANGRTINATELEKILFDFLPACIEKTFFYKNRPRQTGTGNLSCRRSGFDSHTAKRKESCCFCGGSLCPSERKRYFFPPA